MWLSLPLLGLPYCHVLLLLGPLYFGATVTATVMHDPLACDITEWNVVPPDGPSSLYPYNPMSLYPIPHRWRWAVDKMKGNVATLCRYAGCECEAQPYTMAERAAMLVGHPVPTTWARNCTKPADANSPGSGGGDGDAEAATELRKRYLIPCQSSCDCVDPDLAASRGLQAAEVEYVNGRIQWRMPSSRYLTWDQRNRMFVGHMDEDTSLGEPSDVMIRGGSSTGSGEEEVTSRLCVNGTCPWDEQEPGEPAAASVAAAALPQQSVPSLAHLANLRLSCTNTNRDRNGCAAGSQPYQRCANRACTGSSDCGSTCDCRKRKRGGQVDLRCRPKRTRINPRDLARQARRGIQQGAATDICACNVTYVSMGCCGAPAGLVHESPDMRMGSVWTSDDRQQALLKWDGPRASTQAAIDVVEEEEDEEDDEDEDEDETQVEE